MKVRLYSLDHDEIISQGVELDAIPRLGETISLTDDAVGAAKNLEVNSSLEYWSVERITWNLIGHADGDEQFAEGVLADVTLDLQRHQVGSSEVDLDQMWEPIKHWL